MFQLRPVGTAWWTTCISCAGSHGFCSRDCSRERWSADGIASRVETRSAVELFSEALHCPGAVLSARLPLLYTETTTMFYRLAFDVHRTGLMCDCYVFCFVFSSWREKMLAGSLLIRVWLCSGGGGTMQNPYNQTHSSGSFADDQEAERQHIQHLIIIIRLSYFLYV